MKVEEFASYDGLGLAGLVRRGEVSAREVLDAAIARVEACNPTLNAVIAPLYDQAQLLAYADDFWLLAVMFAAVPLFLPLMRRIRVQPASTSGAEPAPVPAAE